jgi:hypothetical protein
MHRPIKIRIGINLPRAQVQSIILTTTCFWMAVDVRAQFGTLRHVIGHFLDIPRIFCQFSYCHGIKSPPARILGIFWVRDLPLLGKFSVNQ